MNQIYSMRLLSVRSLHHITAICCVLYAQGVTCEPLPRNHYISRKISVRERAVPRQFQARFQPEKSRSSECHALTVFAGSERRAVNGFCRLLCILWELFVVEELKKFSCASIIWFPLAFAGKYALCLTGFCLALQTPHRLLWSDVHRGFTLAFKPRSIHWFTHRLLQFALVSLSNAAKMIFKYFEYAIQIWRLAFNFFFLETFLTQVASFAIRRERAVYAAWMAAKSDLGQKLVSEWIWEFGSFGFLGLVWVVEEIDRFYHWTGRSRSGGWSFLVTWRSL